MMIMIIFLTLMNEVSLFAEVTTTKPIWPKVIWCGLSELSSS